MAPMLLGLSTFSTVLAALASIFLVAILRMGRRDSRLPPGPPTIPIFGNIHQLKKSYIRLAEWDLCFSLKQKYGGLMSLKLGNQTAIVLQDDGTSIRDLLEKRGSIYSARPRNTPFDIISSYDHPVAESVPIKWHLNRKLIMQQFHSSVSNKQHFVRVQEAETTHLLEDLLTDPGQYEEHVLRFAVSVLTETAYGFRTPTSDHFYMRATQEFWNTRSSSHGWIPPVDFWPFLKYLPQWVSPWRRHCEEMKTMGDNIYGGLSDISKNLYAQGELDPSTFAYKLFSEQSRNKMNDHWLAMLLSGILEGGSDILANSVCTSMLALLTHPEVQAKAHAEIDQACDEDTLPTMEDYKRMGYVRSIGKESLRWRPPFPMGVLHSLEKDDQYRGYHLPKGSTVAINIWAIHQNPERYPDPARFIPERFEGHTSMTGDYVSNPDPFARDHFAFGAGRRSCPGVYIAEQAQFLTIAKILWAFQITYPPGVSEVDTGMLTAFQGGALIKPKRFPFVLIPRSEKRVAVIQREIERLKEERGGVSKGVAEAESKTSFEEGYRWTPSPNPF